MNPENFSDWNWDCPLPLDVSPDLTGSTRTVSFIPLHLFREDASGIRRQRTLEEEACLERDFNMEMSIRDIPAALRFGSPRERNGTQRQGSIIGTLVIDDDLSRKKHGLTKPERLEYR
jgi:hypothetical protein